MELLQLLHIPCSLVTRPVIHTRTVPALGLSVSDRADQSDSRPPPAGLVLEKGCKAMVH